MESEAHTSARQEDRASVVKKQQYMEFNSINDVSIDTDGQVDSNGET